MTPAYKSAGLSILRYVYETCELHGVQKGDIAELMTDLRDAVLIGQHEPAPFTNRRTGSTAHNPQLSERWRKMNQLTELPEPRSGPESERPPEP